MRIDRSGLRNWKDTLLLLRVPFSYYLFPVFLLGVSQSPNSHARTLWMVLIAQHFFIYPGSNLYNSYMDEDEQAIGGLEHPPPVTRSMYYVSMVFDAIGLGIGFLAGWQHGLIMLGYVCFSKAYSWRGIRLKSMPFLGWASVALFQGAFTFLQGYTAASDALPADWLRAPVLFGMLLSLLLIGGSYPLTQVYQHEEDGGRGDYTISWKLGVRGTFIFSSCNFLLAGAVGAGYFLRFHDLLHAGMFLTALGLAGLYFTTWMWRVFQEDANADYRHAMWMNKISATCMIVCFGAMWWMK